MNGDRSCPGSRRIFFLGGTGTVGCATVREFVTRGHEVVCFGRRQQKLPGGAQVRLGDVTDPDSVRQAGFCGERFDTLVSCLASRTGAPGDAWAIDHEAHVNALEAAKEAGVRQVILLSAICVQKPRLAFQHAKLAFEDVLRSSGMTYSIVRPTALFKSLSGQIDRVRRGKPFVMFGNGTLTSCKPIGTADLADYLAGCLDDESRYNRILPIGGPGKAITPKEQGEHLFALLGLRPRYFHVPVALLDIVVHGLGTLARVAPPLAVKAELARIAKYYATESMLVLDRETGHYDAAATPAHGSETLFDHYARVIRDGVSVDLGEHAVF